MSNYVDNGKVLKVTSSESRNGTMWRIQVEDEYGTDWFGLGKEKPDFGEGSVINFEFSETDDGKYKNAFADSIEVVEKVEAQQQGRGGRGNSRSSGGGSRPARGNRGDSDANSGGRNTRGSGRGGDAKPSRGSRNQGGGDGASAKPAGKKEVDWEAKDKRIEIMSARNSAIALITAAVQAEAIPLGTKTTKPGDKFDLLSDLVDKVTAKFLSDNEEFVTNGSGFLTEGAGDGEDEE